MAHYRVFFVEIDAICPACGDRLLRPDSVPHLDVTITGENGEEVEGFCPSCVSLDKELLPHGYVAQSVH